MFLYEVLQQLSSMSVLFKSVQMSAGVEILYFYLDTSAGEEVIVTEACLQVSSHSSELYNHYVSSGARNVMM